MPQFPRYQSKGQINSQQTSFLAPEDNSGSLISEAGSRIGNTLQDVGQKSAEISRKAAEIELKKSQALNTIQKTTVKANVKGLLSDVIQRATEDKNVNNEEQYYKEIDKSLSDQIKGINNPLVKNEVFADLSLESKIAKAKIKNIFWKNKVDVGRSKALELVDDEVNNPTEGSLSSIQNILDTQVRDGIFSHEEAYKIQKNSEQKLKFNSFLRDFRGDPVGAEKKFNKDSYGMDVETSEKARSKLKELKVLQREQEGELYSDMGLKVVTGEITDDEINLAMQANKLNPNEGITEAHGKQLLAARYRDVTQRIGSKEFKKYKQALDFVFSSSLQDRVKGYEAVLEAYENGLDGEEVKFLDQILKTKKDIVFANKAAAGKKLIETLFGARVKDPQKETRALLDYAKRIAKGSSPETAAQDTAVDIVQQEHPATIADPDLVVAFTPHKGLKNIPKVKSQKTKGSE